MKQKGYTLLYAVLLSGIVLIIGVSIVMISRREIQLSEDIGSSAQAIYAADSGIECMVELNNNGSIGIVDDNNPPNVKCLGQGGSGLRIESDGGVTGATAHYEIRVERGNGPELYTFMVVPGEAGQNPDLNAPCFQVEPIIKDSLTVGLTTYSTTTIVVNGYNTCNVDDPRRVERTLEVSTYNVTVVEEPD